MHALQLQLGNRVAVDLIWTVSKAQNTGPCKHVAKRNVLAETLGTMRLNVKKKRGEYEKSSRIR